MKIRETGRKRDEYEERKKERARNNKYIKRKKNKT